MSPWVPSLWLLLSNLTCNLEELACRNTLGLYIRTTRELLEGFDNVV